MSAYINASGQMVDVGVGNPLPTNGTAQGPLTDRSGTGTGASVTAAAANANRRYLLFQNPTGAIASFWLKLDGSTAAVGSPSVEVAAGVTLTFDGSFIPTGAINVFAASGIAYTIKEG